MSAKALEIPELSIIHRSKTNTKKQTPEKIKKLLLPVDHLDLCDEDSNSDYSQLFDKYKDLYKEEYRLKTYQKTSVLDQFTEDYKETVMELREELQVNKIKNTVNIYKKK